MLWGHLLAPNRSAEALPRPVTVECCLLAPHMTEPLRRGWEPPIAWPVPLAAWLPKAPFRQGGACLLRHPTSALRP